MIFQFGISNRKSARGGRRKPATVFTEQGVAMLASVLPGRYAFRGELKYQACDNASCYPPKKIPVQFEVKVVKAPPPHRKNPGQSPHVHN